MKKKYSEKDLLGIINEVEVEFQKHLEETANIKKTEEAKEPPMATKEDDKVDPIDQDNEFDYNDEDMEELKKMYMSMSKKEAELHLQKLKEAMEEKGFVEKAATDKEQVDPAIQNVMKSEAHNDELLKTEISTLKSEIEVFKSENADLKAKIEKIVNVMSNGFKKVPQQKAVTAIDLNKHEEDLNKNYSQAEINKKLTEKIRSGDLKKSDKDAIQEYFNKKSVDLIKHLL